MSLIVPSSLEVIILNDLLNTPLTMRLFGNNITPSHSDSTSGYTEIAGGGYLPKALIFANWTVTLGEPSVAVYNSTQQWTFNGVINSPGSIYGYYVTRNSDNQLMWAQQFDITLIPFSPINGSIIRVLPRLSSQSLF